MCEKKLPIIAVFVAILAFHAVAEENISDVEADISLTADSTTAISEDSLAQADSIIQDSIAAHKTSPDDSSDVSADSLTTDSSRIDSAQSESEISQSSKPKELYPGISREQDKIALAMVKQVYSFRWKDAEKTGRELQRLERKHDLAPLSYLLLASMKILRVQNNEYPDKRTQKKLIKEIKKMSKKGLDLSRSESAPDSLKETYMLIHAGIKGFRATLKMAQNPIESAMEGMGALKLLEKQVEEDPSIKDGYLGLGIFYCAISKAPTLVRAAVNMTGRKISLEKGLGYLRKAAYEGHYTYGIAQMYLIQFLSPYQGHMVEEKSNIFSSLQKRFPTNPYYVFLELDETLCFHPDRLTLFATGEHYKQKIRNFSTENHSLRKYSTLVKLQYRMIKPLPPQDLEANISVDLKEFSFYPVFLQALKEKLLLKDNTSSKGDDYQKRMQYIKEKGHQAKKMLESSDIGRGRKGFYTWHIEDALEL
ncbi:MAG: hypothetical protein ACLFQB_09040 [Chitinispirillaceae bacterium]